MRDYQGYAMIVLGAGLFAIGLNLFVVPNHLLQGGVTGISLLGFYLFRVPVGLTYFLLNLPLFTVGYRLLGRAFAFRTLAGFSLVSLAIQVTARFQQPTGDLLLASLFAGAFTGLGLGLIFRAGGSTGGVDIIARLLLHFYGWEMGKSILLLDAVIIAGSGLLFGRNVALYSVLATFVASRVIDVVQEGALNAKGVLIISDNPRELAGRILQEMERGVTLLKGEGAYTGRDREILFTVVTRGEITRLKLLVKSADPSAFVVVTDVREVLGHGFAGRIT